MVADDILALKRQLTDEIVAIANQLQFQSAADLLGIGFSRLSDLRRGRIARFSLERLIRILDAAEHGVELRVIHPGPLRTPRRILGDRRRAKHASTGRRLPPPRGDEG